MRLTRLITLNGWVVGARYDFEENQYASGGGNTAQHRIAFTVIPRRDAICPRVRDRLAAHLRAAKPPAW